MHDDVLELPWVLKIEIFLLQVLLHVLQRIPVSVIAAYWTDVLVLHFKTPLIVHLVAFYKSSFRVFKRPNHASDNSRSHLQGCCILVGCSLTS